MSRAETVSPPRPRRSIWFWVGWIALALIVLIVLIGAMAWTQRYSLIERQIIEALEVRGFDADLRLASASPTAADMRNIRLDYEGQHVLSVERLQAEYQWRDLLDGKVEALFLTGLDGTITLDANGTPTDAWIPKGSGGGFVFPPRGLSVQGSRISLQTPFGVVPLSGDAELSAIDDIAFKGQIGPSRIVYEDASIDVRGPLSARRDGNRVSIETSGLTLSLDQPSLQITPTQLDANGTIDLASRKAAGTFTLEGGNLSTPLGVAGRIDTLSADGTYDPETGITATLTPAFRDVRLTDADRRRDVAQTLSLATTLQDVPVARNFSPTLVEPINALLSGADIEGRLSLIATHETRHLSLLTSLNVTNDAAKLTLDPIIDTPFYRYENEAGHYDIRTAASLSNPIPLSLSPLQLIIQSSNGASVDGIESATGRLTSRRTWMAQTEAGRPARLGPLDLRFDYANPDGRKRTLSLQGMADYDGDVPGGDIRGLKAGGRLSATLTEAGPSVVFTPKGPIGFDQLETTSDWAIADFTGTLEPTGPIFTRANNQSARIETELKDARFRAKRGVDAEGGAATANITLAEATLRGRVGETTQNWDVEFGAATLNSATFPVTGTDLTLPSGELSVMLSDTDRTRFSVAAPTSTLITPAYRVDNMALEASGTAEAYLLRYSNGTVTMAPQPGRTPLPVMPATGTLNFADGVFSGQAQTHLPRAADQPFEVTYTLEDGRGAADVTIRDLRFRPGKLQPQDLVPALRGKIAQVDGPIDADLSVTFGGDAPLSGSGDVVLKNISLGTAPGPITGMSGTIRLSSLFPVISAPSQRLTLDRFDPGVPLLRGDLTYALVDGGVQVEHAAWPLGQGQVLIDPFTWQYSAPENRVTLRVTGVDVGEFLKNIGNGRLSATGIIEGQIPVVVRGIDVQVEGGRLEVPGGGFISWKSEEGVIDRVPNKFAADALKALENFRYDALFAEIDGPLGGEIKVGLEFEGTNEDILYGVPFAFDVSLEGELFNIARSFNTNATIKSQVGRNLSVAE